MSLRVSASNSRLVARLKMLYLVPIGVLLIPIVGTIAGIWEQINRFRAVVTMTWRHEPTRRPTTVVIDLDDHEQPDEEKTEVKITTSRRVNHSHDGGDQGSQPS